jgi:UrcA family protein
MLAAPLASAAEAPAVTVRHLRVTYGDLDLGSDAGVNRLYARLRQAAESVCVYATLASVVDQRCAKQALEDAVAAVGNERLRQRLAAK